MSIFSHYSLDRDNCKFFQLFAPICIISISAYMLTYHNKMTIDAIMYTKDLVIQIGGIVLGYLIEGMGNVWRGLN
jgi:hypothetical protein